MRPAGWIALGALAVALAAPAAAQPDYHRTAPRALIQALKSAPAEERAEMVEALARRRAEALPALWDAARFGDRGEKIVACSVIADLRDRDGVDAVVDASHDADVRVRRRAATALRILADRRAAPRLRALLAGEPDSGVLMSALAALGRLGIAADAARLQPFLGHGELGVRVVAAGALAMLGDQRGLELVLDATQVAADPAAQKSAVYALGFFTAPAAAARLQAILDDPDGAWKPYALIAQTERALAAQSPAAQAATLATLARRSGPSRTLATWSVDRLADLDTPAARAALRALADRPTTIGRLAQRRALALEAQP